MSAWRNRPGRRRSGTGSSNAGWTRPARCHLRAMVMRGTPSGRSVKPGWTTTLAASAGWRSGSRAPGAPRRFPTGGYARMMCGCGRSLRPSRSLAGGVTSRSRGNGTSSRSVLPSSRAASANAGQRRARTRFAPYSRFTAPPVTRTVSPSDRFPSCQPQKLLARLSYLVRHRGLGLVAGEVDGGETTGHAGPGRRMGAGHGTNCCTTPRRPSPPVTSTGSPAAAGPGGGRPPADADPRGHPPQLPVVGTGAGHLLQEEPLPWQLPPGLGLAPGAGPGGPGGAAAASPPTVSRRPRPAGDLTLPPVGSAGTGDAGLHPAPAQGGGGCPPLVTG